MKSPGIELEDLQKFLIQKGNTGKAEVQLFLEACLDFQRAKALRLPNILIGLPPPDVSEKKEALRREVKKLIRKYPDAPFLAQIEEEPEIVFKALSEIMWRNL